jgi:Mn-dependent DtxR family transcriptional regulator
MNTADQYLKAIYLVEQLEDGPASTGTLADRLGVSPASVNEMVGKLQERGLVDHEKYQGARVTADGAVRAAEALRTYCILERFLADVLEVEDYRTEARQLEPVIDDTVAERLDVIVDREARCPECFDPAADACALLDSQRPDD